MYIKMSIEIWTSVDMKIEKNKFYRQKTPIFFGRCRYWKSISIWKDFYIMKKIYKYFIGYLYDNHKVKSLKIKQEASF